MHQYYFSMFLSKIQKLTAKIFPNRWKTYASKVAYLVEFKEERSSGILNSMIQGFDK